MLRTFASVWLGIASPPAFGTRRAAAPWTPRARERGTASGSPAPPASSVVVAPWGELPELHRIAVVTTQPFPAEWWRRPRIGPPPDDPFESRVEPPTASASTVIDRPRPSPGRGSSQAEANVSHRASSPAAVSAPAPAPSRTERRHRAHDADQRRRPGRFARLCLVVAGALISWIVVDAAAGRARR